MSASPAPKDEINGTSKNRITLALGGGVALGWAHIGVLKALDRAGIEVSAIAGTSIGALVGGAYLTGHLAELEAFARSTTILRILQFLDVQLHGQGLLGGETVVRELNKYLGGRAIEDLQTPYAAISADLIKGEQFVSREGPLVDAIRASISIPGVFTPLLQGGRCLVDGGIVNPMPVNIARKLSRDPVIGIDVIGDYSGRAESLGIKAWDNKNMLPVVSGVESQSASLFASLTAKLFKRKADSPNLIATLIASYALFAREMTKAQLALSPADMHLEPKIGHISIVEFDRADELIAAGEEIVVEKIEDIRALAASPRRANNV